MGQAKYLGMFEVRSQDLRAVGRALGWNREKENPTWNQPPENVIQEHGLKSFPSVSGKRPVVGGIAIDKRKGLDRAMGFQTVSLNNPN
jgi:hypothetical protein